MRGFARNDRSRPVTWAIPNDFDSSKREESPLPRKIAIRSTSSVRASRSTSDKSILSRSASELDQRAPVVVACPVKELVKLLLNPFPHRIKQQSGDHDGHHQPVRSGTGHACVHEQRNRGHPGKINSHDGRRRQRIRHAALENQIHVHQPVAENGVSKRQRQQSERQHRHLHGGRRHHSEQIRQNIKKREWRYGENGAARNPFELLPQNRSGGLAVVAPQNRRRRDEEDRQISPVHPVQIELQRGAGFKELERYDLYSEKYCSRQIERRNRPAMLADELPPFRKGQHEVQEERRLQQPRDLIGPEDTPVESVEFTDVV